jgi:hypothetical protein
LPPSGSVTPPPELGTATPDGNPAAILPGTYVVLNISGNPVVVSNAPDGNYDLILYEALDSSTSIQMDAISVLISQDGIAYYEVFNWGDNDPDTNTNIDFNTLPIDTLPPLLCVQPSECDNLSIPTSELYSPDVTNPAIPQTGILIDVDTAPDNPPEGTYNYIAIISPLSLDAAQVDSIVVEEVPITP